MNRLRAWFWADPAQPARLGLRALHTVLAVAVLAGILYAAFARIAYHWNWPGVWAYRGLLVRGWLATLGLSAAALVLSSGIGLLAALARRSCFLPFRQGSLVYIELIRGTPLLVQVLVFFYVVASALGLHDRYIAGVLILSLFSGAYIAEIIRAGIDGIGASQLESACAIGFTPAQTYRFVIFPQALRHMLPPLAGQFVSLVKDSSLLSVIAIREFTLQAQQINSYTYSPLETYLPLALGYLAVTWPISTWTSMLERRVRYET
jgi:polar amino acid transport system permease protein